jgi:hypothetical protein
MSNQRLYDSFVLTHAAVMFRVSLCVVNATPVNGRPDRPQLGVLVAWKDSRRDGPNQVGPHNTE